MNAMRVESDEVSLLGARHATGHLFQLAGVCYNGSRAKYASIPDGSSVGALRGITQLK